MTKTASVTPPWDTKSFAKISDQLKQFFGYVAADIIEYIHRWLPFSKHIIGGTPFIYNTAAQWAEKLKCRSERTIRRWINRLEKQNVIISCEPFRNIGNRTKYYTLNYAVIAELLSGQNDQMDTDEMTTWGDTTQETETRVITESVEEPHLDKVAEQTKRSSIVFTKEIYNNNESLSVSSPSDTNLEDLVATYGQSQVDEAMETAKRNQEKGTPIRNMVKYVQGIIQNRLSQGRGTDRGTAPRNPESAKYYSEYSRLEQELFDQREIIFESDLEKETETAQKGEQKTRNTSFSAVSILKAFEAGLQGLSYEECLGE